MKWLQKDGAFIDESPANGIFKNNGLVSKNVVVKNGKILFKNMFYCL